MNKEGGGEIRWRLRLKSSPEKVFALLATDEGRAAFWAERSEQSGDRVTFHFPGGETLSSRILESDPPARYSLSYFDGSTVTFELTSDGAGTGLLLRESKAAGAVPEENRAGWVSVLMCLKARADHGVDLRNHDPRCTWAEGYADN